MGLVIGSDKAIVPAHGRTGTYIYRGGIININSLGLSDNIESPYLRRGRETTELLVNSRLKY